MAAVVPRRVSRGWPLGLTRNAVILISIVVFGFVIRSYRLTGPSLWFDESFSWAVTRFPAPELIERIAADNNPPLYFLTLQTWIRLFGDSVASMRGLSVLCGCAATVGIYLFASEAYKRDDLGAAESSTTLDANSIAWIAALFVSLNAGQIIWAKEMRGYALGTALAAFSSWLLFRALSRPRAMGSWITLGLVNLAFLYTHYYAMFSVAAQALFVAAYLFFGRNPSAAPKREVVRGAGIAFGIAACGFMPWIPILLRQRAQVQADFWTGPLAVDQFTFATNELLFGKNDAYGPIVPQIVAVLHVLVILSLFWRLRIADAYLLTAILVPIALSALSTKFDTKIITPRYFLFAHLFFLVAAARLVCRIRETGFRRTVVAVLVANALFIWSEYFSGLHLDDRPGGRGAMAYLDEHRTKGEPVITCSPLLHYSLLYYTHDRNGWYVNDDPEFPLSHYRGKPLVRPSELISMQGMERLDRQYAWVADMQSGWTHGHVRVPSHWTRVSQEEFPEVYNLQGTTILTKYRVKAN